MGKQFAQVTYMYTSKNLCVAVQPHIEFFFFFVLGLHAALAKKMEFETTHNIVRCH